MAEIQADTGRARSGRFLPGHKPYKVYGLCGGRGRPGKDEAKDEATAWEWARSQKPAVLRALVDKAIKGHHPSIELYLAYVDGRPVETFRTTNFNVNASPEDIRELADKIEANKLAFERELGIEDKTKLFPGAACTPVAEIIADASIKSATKPSSPP